MIKIIEDFEINTPSWVDILHLLNGESDNKEKFAEFSYGYFISHSAYKIPLVKNILKKLNLNEAHLYVNILNSKGLDFHRDDCDVWFWQIQGGTSWEIEDGSKYYLKTGDLMFIPQNIGHKVTSLIPRAGVSMSR